MPIIPKLSGNGSGLIRGAASALAGTVTQQVKGAVAREAVGIKPQNVLGQVGRVVDLKTGGLLSAGKKLLGARGSTDDPQGLIESDPDQALTTNGLSQWGGLNPNLFATLSACDAEGAEVPVEQGDPPRIIAPATDVQFESTLNWQSPFENSGPESKAPTIMALIQTGQIATVANLLQSVLPDGALGDLSKDVAAKAERWAKSLEGRTGITKLNSRQVFSGMPPVRITLQLHLRAVSNPQEQVVAPYQQLLKWAWPQHLAKNGILSEVITNEEGFIHAMFPSKAPQMVALTYGNNRYSPMVIESVGNTLDGPMDRQGRPLYRSVQLTLATLTAKDMNDVDKIFNWS